MRFDGFNKVWESKQIGEIAEVVGGGTPKTEIVDYWDGEIKWFTPSEIGKTKYVFDSGRHITEKGLKNSSAKLLPKDALLLSSRATVGEISIALTECSTNQGFQSLITKSNVDNDFIYYLISTIKNEFLRRSSGSTFLEINKNEIKRMPINIPELSEQKKISNLFSAIDNKIEMLEKKCEYYQDFKKYLMQRIFSSSDDKLRFKNDKQWNVYLLRNFINEYNERMGNKSNLPILSSTLNGIFLQNEYFNKSVSSKDVKNYKIVPNGYFTYRSMSDTGKFRFNIQSIVEVGIISPAYPVFSTQNIDDYFLYYYLNNSNFIKKQILSLKEGGTRYALSFSKFKKLKISLPSLEEQKKIANFLSAVDKKIDLIQTQIQKMEEFKKGLLQQMFVVRINWRCNFKLAKSPSFNKHLLILKNKIIFIIIK